MDRTLLDGAPEPVVKLIVEMAAARLEAQNRFADTQDTRASQIAAACATLAAAAIAIAVQGSPVLEAAAIGGGFVFFVAGLVAQQAARSCPFESAGFFPSDFLNDLKAGRAEAALQVDYAVALDKRLHDNSLTLAKRGDLGNLALLLMILAPCAAAFGGAICWAMVRSH